MNKHQQYQLRLGGLKQADGHIKACDLNAVVDALLKTAECATRLAATGRSTAKGTRPEWLRASIDFVITGLAQGSTVLHIQAPRLADVAGAQFSQKSLWAEVSLQPEASALDLAARAINEAQGEHIENLDDGILDAMLKFQHAIHEPKVTYELTPSHASHGRFLLNQQSYDRITEYKQRIPEPRACIVSGRIDRISHGTGDFLLVVGEGKRLTGHLEADMSDREILRSLWGESATVEGMIHFGANGQARYINARKISRFTQGDEGFRAMPQVDLSHTRGELPHKLKQAAAEFDPMILWGTWPGDESLEELMAELSRIRSQ